MRQPQGSRGAHPGGGGGDDGGRRRLRSGVRRESGRHGELPRASGPVCSAEEEAHAGACSMLQTSALESTRDGWGVCVIAGWTETESMSVKVEKLLMGRRLQATYFGGK